eukprot:UN09882
MWKRTIEIRGDDYHPDPWYNLGVAYSFRDMTDESIESYEKALLLHKHPHTVYNLGLQLHKKNRLKEASEKFIEAIELDPMYLKPRNNLAVTLFELGQIEESILQFEYILQLDPSHIEAQT